MLISLSDCESVKMHVYDACMIWKADTTRGRLQVSGWRTAMLGSSMLPLVTPQLSSSVSVNINELFNQALGHMTAGRAVMNSW